MRRSSLLASWLALSAAGCTGGDVWVDSTDGGDPSGEDAATAPGDAASAVARPDFAGRDLLGIDLTATPPAPGDLAMAPIVPVAVGPGGGAVQLLHFGLSGDTRPPACEDTAHYPVQIIDAIAQHLRDQRAQFVIDLGDHMYVCNDDLATATAQMNLFMNAPRIFGGTWFMVEGNHECWKGPCLAGSVNANYLAFMKALAPVAKRPYYSFDVATSLGRATFVTVADNSWDTVQSKWLDATLATADQQATYTIVLRHHPEGDSSVATNGDSMNIIRAHKFALLVTGHEHLYRHMAQTDRGRDVVIGNAGAPLIVGGSFFGYALVDQIPNGQLQFAMYDVMNDHAPVDVFTVGPN